jgi:pimeloyl-ACP methyl ester carboxylesterase
MAAQNPTGRVQSSDGTEIAYERSGTGSPIILIGGAFNDRSTAAPLAAQLAPHFTVFTYDRRGRGDSGDTAPYAVAREVEDLAALIAEAGGTVALYGLSSGAILALEAAAGGLPVTRLALFEPPYTVADSRPRPSATLPAELAELTRAGRGDDAVALFLTRLVGLPPEAVAQMRQAPMWPGLVKLAHTLVYDTAVSGDGTLPAGRLAAVTVPALLINSNGSPDWLHVAAHAVVDTLPDARHRTLEGQFHSVEPEVLAPVIVEFVGA